MSNKFFTKARLKNWAINIGMILIVYVGLQLYYGRDLPSAKAPNFQGLTLQQQSFNLAEQFQQGPVLVHFWATWCSICRIEQGSIDNIAEDHQVIAVASNSGSWFEVAKVAQQRGITVPVLVDPGGGIAAKYGVKGYPTSIIVNRQGEVSFSEVGYTTEIGLRLRLWWAGL